mmetsp:Transcript_61987/g.134374  ORF Transcript_61987/g.134374 Transcript_61987/m.134374 type:complete len:369 (+) Transcript_61987:198-1304(+)
MHADEALPASEAKTGTSAGTAVEATAAEAAGLAWRNGQPSGAGDLALEADEIAEVVILNGRHKGSWVKCRVLGHGDVSGAYNVHVLPTKEFDNAGGASNLTYPNVRPQHLRKLMPEEPEADYAVEDPVRSAADSSSDDDGMPPLDAYWAAKLNVSKVSDPLPAAKLVATGQTRSDGRGKGKGGKDKGKGYTLVPPVVMGPMGPMWNPLPVKGGWKKGWKGSSRPSDNIGDFVAWAKDPTTEDGTRDRSRSPTRRHESKCLEQFISWARDEDAVKAETKEEDEAGTTLSSFMAWATNGAAAEVTEAAEEEKRPEEQRAAPAKEEPVEDVDAELKTARPRDHTMGGSDDDDSEAEGALFRYATLAGGEDD